MKEEEEDDIRWNHEDIIVTTFPSFRFSLGTHQRSYRRGERRGQGEEGGKENIGTEGITRRKTVNEMRKEEKEGKSEQTNREE